MQAQRLKTRQQFQAVLACAPLARTEHFVMHRLDLQTAEPKATPPLGVASSFPNDGLWLGAMVPKRWARRAVTRNLIKRQIYSAGVRHAASLQAAAYLVRLRAGFDRHQFRSASSEQLRTCVHAEIDRLFSKALRPVRVVA